MQETICAVSRGMAGGRLAIQWDREDYEITFMRDESWWFWSAYSRKVGRNRSSGRAATIEAAVEQALDAVRTPALAAELGV